MNNRLHPRLWRESTLHWAQAIAAYIVEQDPDREVYTCESGITPSGTVHFGNLREIITVSAVGHALKALGKKTTVLFVWDDFDRYRKVPANVEASFSQYIGQPVSKIPDPCGSHKSYAMHFEQAFEHSLKEFAIDVSFVYQSERYESGLYDDLMIHALAHRTEIARIILSHMTQKSKDTRGITEEIFINSYYPIQVYSKHTGTDETEILGVEKESLITYRCIRTNAVEQFDLRTDRRAKLRWKVDWAMRWKYEGVVFEPAGHDHASPGSSFDVSSDIARNVFGCEPPFLAEFKFVGIQGQGGKMSGSKGNAISPAQLLEIFEPEILAWQYFRKSPDQQFQIALDSETIRLYDEFDRSVAGIKAGTASPSAHYALTLAGADTIPDNPIPFRQAVAFGQLTQWDPERVNSLRVELGETFNPESVLRRLLRAKAWLEKYNPDEMIHLRTSVNQEQFTKLSDESRAHIEALRQILTERKYTSLHELEALLYEIPKIPESSEKENAARQKEFFKDVYRLLIDKDRGPRLATFLWVIGTPKIIPLLSL